MLRGGTEPWVAADPRMYDCNYREQLVHELQIFKTYPIQGQTSRWGDFVPWSFTFLIRRTRMDSNLSIAQQS